MAVVAVASSRLLRHRRRNQSAGLAFFAFLFFVASAGAMGALHDQEAEEAGRVIGMIAVPARARRDPPSARGRRVSRLGGPVRDHPASRVPPGPQTVERARGVVGFSETIALREVTGIKSDPRVVAGWSSGIAYRAPPGEPLPSGHVSSSRGRGLAPRWSDSPTASKGRIPPLVGDAAVPVPRTSPSTRTTRPLRLRAPDADGGVFAPPVFSDRVGPSPLRVPRARRSGYGCRLRHGPPRRTRIERRAGTEDLASPRGTRTCGPRAGDRRSTDSVGEHRESDRALLRLRFPLHPLIPPRGSGSSCSGSGPATASISPPDCHWGSAAREFHHRHSFLGGGEWNGIGKYLIVHNRIHTRGSRPARRALVTLTRPALRGLLPLPEANGDDAAVAGLARQAVGDKYVVNYSMRMQADAVKEGVRAVRRTGTAFPVPGMGRDRRHRAAQRGLDTPHPSPVSAATAFYGSGNTAREGTPARPLPPLRPVRAPRPSTR